MAINWHHTPFLLASTVFLFEMMRGHEVSLPWIILACSIWGGLAGACGITYFSR